MITLRSLQDRMRSSLFVVPMMFVFGGVVLGELALAADDRVDGIPTGLTATVDSGRSVLAVVAGATLSFAGIAFSVSLLLISLAASQFSPRVVHGLFRDPFNTRVMGIVVGTFTYCLVVLRRRARAVRRRWRGRHPEHLHPPRRRPRDRLGPVDRRIHRPRSPGLPWTFRGSFAG